ncbi:MAG: hypothetical protein OXI67_07830 [Candidatus Poribacteria bacterium]|nr:hypothetical protein [Candidatus Poribacteria bacterium]
MEQFHFNYKDIFRINRYGFSCRRIGIHLAGILLGYLIYEILLYLTLFIVDGTKAQAFWENFGLLPVLPFTVTNLNPLTTGTMWIGIVAFAAIFFLVSTMASKITIEQLRGDVFFSVGNSLNFLKQNWKAVFGSFFGLVFIIFFLFLIPGCVVLLGKIPFLGKPILTLASLFTPVAFIIGLLIVFILTVLIASLFFAPAIAATTNADAFETIYQLFAIVWNQPWRIVGYGIFLLVLKLIFVPIWAIFCLAGFAIILLPMYYLHTTFIQESMAVANKWLGETLQKFTSLLFQDNSVIFGINTSQPPITTLSITICAILITLTLICIAGGVVAYLFSLASVGTTLIYTMLRKHIDGQNLLETIGTVGQVEDTSLPIEEK